MIAAWLLAGMRRRSPIIDTRMPAAYLDLDDTVRQTFGCAGHGVGFGYSGVKDPLEVVYSPWATHG